MSSAGDKLPPLGEQSNKGSDTADYENCLPCRITGSATFVGLGVYILTLRMDPQSLGVSDRSKAVSRILSKQGPRIRGGLGATFALLGLYRLIN